MTNKQKKEIECLNWFMPFGLNAYNENSHFKNPEYVIGVNTIIKETPNGILPEEAYFEITDKGKKIIDTNDKPRLIQLLNAQQWRLRMMSEYEQGILMGCGGWYTLMGFEGREKGIWNSVIRFYKKLKGIELEERTPECVIDFMARTMFKGIDKQVMLDFYNREKLRHI